MFKSANSSPKKRPVTAAIIDDQIVSVVDKKVVTVFAIVLMSIVFVSLYAQHQNEMKINNAEIQRCEQRRRLDALASHEANELSQIDIKYFSKYEYGWVHDRRASLLRYSLARQRYGEEQCNAGH